jgi:hypothetical protein
VGLRNNQKIENKSAQVVERNIESPKETGITISSYQHRDVSAQMPFPMFPQPQVPSAGASVGSGATGATGAGGSVGAGVNGATGAIGATGAGVVEGLQCSGDDPHHPYSELWV